MGLSPDLLKGLLAGLLLGFALAGFVGRAAQMARRGTGPWARIQAFTKPQVTVSKQTPWQVLLGCASGAVQILIWLAIVTLAVVLLARGCLFPS
ncbi:MAG: hypothetical protein V1772_14320 [Chloroflexota bacterium]